MSSIFVEFSVKADVWPEISEAVKSIAHYWQQIAVCVVIALLVSYIIRLKIKIARIKAFRSYRYS